MDNPFDQLPNDIKFYLFSFLHIRDVVNVTTLNQANRKLDKNDAFWYQRTLIDFGLPIPAKVNAKYFYTQLVEKRNQERHVIYLNKILQSCDSIARETTKRELIMGSHLKFISLAQDYIRQRTKPYKAIDFNILYNSQTKALLKEMSDIIAALATVKPKENNVDSNDDSEKAFQKAGELIMCFANNNAWISLREFFCQIPKNRLREIIKFESAYLIFFKALYYGNAEIIETILNLGFNANAKCHLFGFPHVPLNSTLIDLSRCTKKIEDLIYIALKNWQFIYAYDLFQYYSARVNTYKIIITTLLHYGADPDLAGTTLIDPTNSPQVGSPRDHATALLAIANPSQRINKNIALRVLFFPFVELMNDLFANVLQIIIDAKKLKSQNETANTRASINPK